MSVKFRQNVFDVIIHSGRADVEFVGNGFCALTFAKLLRTSISRAVRRTLKLGIGDEIVGAFQLLLATKAMRALRQIDFQPTNL